MLLVPRTESRFADFALPTGAAVVATGVALLAIGLLTWLDRAGTGRGGLAMLAALAALAGEWEGWAGGPMLARSTAMVVQPFFLPIVAHLVLSRPSGRLDRSQARLMVGIGYVGAAVVGLGMALFRDPFFDPACPLDCRYNAFLVSSQPTLVRVLAGGWEVASLGLGLGVIIATIAFMASATRTAATIRQSMLVPSLIIGGEAATRAILAMLERLFPHDPRLALLLLVRSFGIGTLALGLGFVLLRSHRTRMAVSRLAAELGGAPRPGSLATALARATGDPTVEVVYPLPGGRLVDASGLTVTPPSPGKGRAVTPIVSRDRTVAYIAHDAATVDGDEIRREAGAAARLAIENERLQAEVLAQLADLRAARVRLVEAADAERRRLERDLHDGAQQRLLALGYDLRLAASAANARGDRHAIDLLASAIADVDEAVAALRDLAHGIYPAVLTEAGIGPAVWSLGDDSPIVVDVRELPTERFAPAVERTAFEVVAQGIDTAAAAASSAVSVRVGREGDNLVVELDGIGEGPFPNLVDRVGALGGSFQARSSSLRAEIPCASL